MGKNEPRATGGSMERYQLMGSMEGYQLQTSGNTFIDGTENYTEVIWRRRVGEG